MERLHRVAVALALACGLFLAAVWLYGAAPGVWGLSLGTLAIEALLVVLALGFAAAPGIPLGARLGLGPGRLPAIGVVAVAAGTLALSLAADSVISALGLRETGTLGQLDRTLAGARGAPLAFAFLALALAPACAEELCFRGWIQGGLARWLPPLPGRAALSVGVAAFAFALVHADAVHSTATFALGLYLGCVAWIAGSIRPAVACHLANNAVALLGTAFGLDPRVPVVPALVLGLGLGGAGLAVALRTRRPEPPEPDPGGPLQPPPRSADGTDREGVSGGFPRG